MTPTREQPSPLRAQQSDSPEQVGRYRILEHLGALGREAEKGHLVRVNELINRGADVNSKDLRGETVLMKVAAKGHIEIVKRLMLLSEFECNEIDPNGETALMKAAATGQQDVVEALLRLAGPRIAVNLKDHKGKTALTKAREANFPAIVKMIQAVGGKE